MKKALLCILYAFLCSIPLVRSFAQIQPTAPAQGNINGVLFAIGYGGWTVPQGNAGINSWSSGSFCTASWGGTTFPAFTVGTPIRILDQTNPATNENVTVTAVLQTSETCSISTTTPVSQHQQYSYTSATAGLQEAIDANLGTTVPLAVVLTSDWFRAGGTLSMVLTSIAGNTSIGVVDFTKTPTGWYAWNGTNYAATGGAGGSVCPAGVCNSNGIAYGPSYQVGVGASSLVQLNSLAQLPAVSAALLLNFPTLNQSTTGNAATASALGAVSALPNGTTATSQSGGDNTAKVATDAFVQAAISASGGGSVTNFTFPTSLLGLGSCSVANPTTTPTVTCSVSNAAANSVYGNFTGSSAAPGFSATPIFNASGLTNLNASAISSGTISSARLPAIAVPQGGTGLASVAANQTPIGSGVNTYALATLPSCSGAGQALSYNSSTQTYTCGTFAVSICHGTLIPAGTIFTGTQQIVATQSCPGLQTTDTITLTPNSNIFIVQGWLSSTNGIIALSAYPTAGQINVVGENNTINNFTLGSQTVNYSVIR